MPLDLNDRLKAGATLAELIEATVCDLSAGKVALDELVAAVAEADTRGERIGIAANFYSDPRLQDAAVLAATDPDAITAVTMRLEAIPGMTRAAAALRKRLFSLAKEMSVSERRGKMQAVSKGDLIELDLSADIKLPAGWSLQADGLYIHMETPAGDVKSVRVARRPIIITGILRSIDDEAVKLCIEWRGHKGEHMRRIVSREVIADRSIVTLAAHGADVGSHNSKDSIRWLADLEGVNGSTLPTASLATRMGWIGQTPGPMGFLVGHRVIGGVSAQDDSPSTWSEGAVQLHAEDGQEQDADGYSASGALQGWREAITPALAFPGPCLALYASLASPLVALIKGAPNAVLDWSGHTSRGKTTVLRLAASVWGPPLKIGEGGPIRSWSATPASLESVATFGLDLPMLLDETSEVPEKEHSLIGRFIYSYANATGKGRAKAEGGHRRTSAFRGVLLSTGEAPITSFGQAGGARARTLCFRGYPFHDDNQAALVDFMISDLGDHHGTAGPAMLETLCAHPGRWPALQERYDATLARYMADTEDSVAKRLARVIALLDLGAHMAHKVLGLPVPEMDPLQVAWEVAHESAEDADRPAAALRSVYSWAVQHQVEFWHRHEFMPGVHGGPRQPSKGWAGVWETGEWGYIAFVPDVLAKVIKYGGYPSSTAVIDAWSERGWILKHGRNRKRSRKINGSSVMLICIARKALTDTGAIVEDDE